MRKVILKRSEFIIILMLIIFASGMTISHAASERTVHKYKLYEKAMTWNDAKLYCESKGGHLVTITDESEQKKVKALLSDPQFEGYWMGASIVNGSWKWVTGESFTYSNWYPGEPNDCEEGMCLQMFSTYRYTPGTWDDTWNNGDKGDGIHVQGFICEWDSSVKTVKVKFDANGGKIRPASITVDAGKKLSSIPKAGRKGYKFKGWYTRKKYSKRLKYGSKLTKKTSIKKDCTYYAQWTKVKKEKQYVKNNKKAARNNSKKPASGKKSAVSKSKKWTISESSILGRYEIPGIGTTSRVPQGLCLTPEYILISCYNCYKGDGICADSEILVLNRKGKFLTALQLKLDEGKKISYNSRSHVGGLAYDPDLDLIYIADSDEYFGYKNSDSTSNIIWKLPVSAVNSAVSTKKGKVPVLASEAFVADIKASCVTYYNGYIYVGQFDEKTAKSRMKAYYYNYGEYLPADGNENTSIPIPAKTQGIAFREEGGCTYAYFSTSYGRSEPSRLIKMAASGSYPVSSLGTSTSSVCKLPNMSENICIEGGNIFVLFESGAYKYISENKKNLFPLNAVLNFNLDKLKFK